MSVSILNQLELFMIIIISNNNSNDYFYLTRYLEYSFTLPFIFQTDIKIVGSGKSGYIDWRGNPSKQKFTGNRKIMIKYARNWTAAWQGMENMLAEQKTYYAMCEKVTS